MTQARSRPKQKSVPGREGSMCKGPPITIKELTDSRGKAWRDRQAQTMPGVKPLALINAMKRHWSEVDRGVIRIRFAFWKYSSCSMVNKWVEIRVNGRSKEVEVEMEIKNCPNIHGNMHTECLGRAMKGSLSLKFFWLCLLFVAVQSLVAKSRRCSLAAVNGLISRGFSCCGARALGQTGFGSCGSWAIERRLSSCSAWT